jgi:hypothetical protein
VPTPSRWAVILSLVVAPLAGQGAAPQPAIAVLNLRFDGEHANVLQPGDTAVAAAATSALRTTLQGSDRLAVVDSARVAAAVAAREADGNPCDNACGLAVARELGAAWVARGRITKTSNLVWVFVAELLDVGGSKAVLRDSYELKGDATRMAPAGARVFAQRIERALDTATAAVGR